MVKGLFVMNYDHSCARIVVFWSMVPRSCRHSEFLQLGNNRSLAEGPDGLIPHLAASEIEQGRNGLDAKARGQPWIAVDVDLNDLNAASLLKRNFVQHRGKHLARPAPSGPKIHQNRPS